MTPEKMREAVSRHVGVHATTVTGIGQKDAKERLRAGTSARKIGADK